MVKTLSAAGGTILLVLCIALLALGGRPGPGSERTLAATAGTSAPSARVISRPDTATIAPPGTIRPDAAGLDVEQLLKTGDAPRIFAAYEALRTCLDAAVMRQAVAMNREAQGGDLDSMTAKIALRCKDDPPVSTARRLELLRAAVNGGVPGAASRELMEGPFGDVNALTDRPEDPLVVAWKAKVLEDLTRAAAHADTEAAGDLASMFEDGFTVVSPDLRRSLQYQWVYAALLERSNPRAAAKAEATAESLARKLPADEVASARQAADEVLAGR
jgi:hypothetical protein